MANSKKTAVILVHGIGEQRPMNTLWSFIDAAWSQDRSLIKEYDSAVYSKPGITSDNYELRRVTTRYFDPPEPRRIDFFEYYWAHMMTGNTVAGIARWVVSLFVRSPRSIPSGYLGYWIAGWTVGLAITAAAIWWQLRGDSEAWLTVLLGLAGPALTSFVIGLLVPRVGDAARYLRADPDNVEARQRIRAAGVELLGKLSGTGDYDRIVLVGHSLGSVIAYDILTQAWAEVEAGAMKILHSAGSDALKCLTALEAAGASLRTASPDEAAAARRAYRNAQRAYRRVLAAGDSPLWLVSDLITLGSPLGKADLLLADDSDAFAARKTRREFPTSPPLYEYWSDEAKQFSFPKGAGPRVPHHATPFAPTVWTNHYFPTSLLILGDPISGAVSPHFGPGVEDVRLPRGALRFQHLDYWRIAKPGDEPEAVKALRKALNLRDRDEAAAPASQGVSG